MTCDQCGTENAPSSKFCHECGRPLTAHCPSCGVEVDPDHKFCHECGTAMTAAGAPGSEGDAGRGDRRFVSVLFSDLVGYTTLAEGRDPDDVRDLLTDYFERARSAIERYGGVVEKYIGDAIFGVWGTELVREDDAERAVRAGFDLVAAVAALGEERNLPGLQVRVGVMSGATSVGPGGNEGTGMIVGDLVNTAARLQAAAEPGTVLVGRGTHEVTESAITYGPRRELALKGKAEPVAAWTAVRPGVRLGGDQHQRALPFVGRRRELHLLSDWLEAATSDARARMALITGEAGIGKSRLVHEFMNQVDGYAEDVYWHHGRSPSYGDGIPLWSLIEMIRQRAGIREDEADERAITRLRTMLAEYIADVDDRHWIEGWFTGLLGLGEMPAGSRSELMSALRTFFQHVARRGPTVLVFEDLHWADAAVVEFIAELVGRSTRAPILVIALARPELFERHPGFGAQLRSSVNVALAGLADAEMREALDDYLGRPYPDLVDRIVARAAGYPLYAAEILRMLQNDGVLVEDDDGFAWHGDDGALAVPETLQAVIGARIDRLDDGVRSTLRTASVLGSTFHADAVRAVDAGQPDDVDAALVTLVRLDVLEIVEDPRSPERGQYRFVQGLIQEVAYAGLSRDERRARHIAAAAWFGRHDDPETAAVVAQHYVGAYDASPDGPEREALVASAKASLVEAAERSSALHADSVAMDLWDRAIALSDDDRERIEWQLAAARSASAHGDLERAERYVTAAETGAARLADPRLSMRVAARRAAHLNDALDAPAAVRVIEPVYRSLSLDDEDALPIAAQAVRSYSLAMQTDEAVAAADRVLPIAERQGDAATVIDILISRGTALTFGGRSLEGLSTIIGAYELAGQHGLLDQALRAVNNVAALYDEVDVRRASEWQERLGALAERAGLREGQLRSEHWRATAALSDGRLSEARERLDRLAEQGLAPNWEAFVALARAMVGLRAGEPDADAIAREAISAVTTSDDPQLRGVVDTADAVRLLMSRRWSDAAARALAAAPRTIYATLFAVLASARAGDAAQIASELVPVLAGQPRGGIRSGLESLVGAVDLASRGELAEAGELAERAFNAFEASGWSEYVMVAAAAIVAAFPADAPTAIRAAHRVREWLDTHDAPGWQAVVGDLLPAAEASPRAVS